MSQRKYRLDVCPECKVREGVSSRKRVFQCSHCERWFCKKHLAPRLTVIRDFKTVIKDTTWRNMIEKEWRRKDGHPDFAYTWERFEELKVQKAVTDAKMEALLDKSKGYGKPVTKEPAKERKLYFKKEIPSYEPKTRKPFPSKKVIGLSLVVLIIGALLWYAPTIISFINPSSQSSQTPTTYSYTNMTLRDLPLYQVNETTAIFGDTDYSFRYLGGILMVMIPFQSKTYTPVEGKTYSDLGIEIKVSKKGSDYISNYIVILVRPTVQNYMFTTFYYTKVNLTLYQTKAVNISSGLINKTNQYWFTYTEVTHPTFSEPKLTIRTVSQSKEYYVIGGFTIREFEIETRVYKIESGYMVIYVKPLY